jgi:hypothetical protein
MAEQRDRVQVFPSRESCEILAATIEGEVGPRLSASLEAWADVLACATRENEGVFSRAEWKMMADCCNGCALSMQPRMAAAIQIWPNVEDGHRLDRTGDKWFKPGRPADAAVAALVAKIRALDEVHAWAVIYAIVWFWDHTDLDAQRVEWWTLAVRRAGAGRA